MSARLRMSRELAGGMLFLAVGVLAMWMSSDLGMGTLRLVGPGAMPFTAGGAMVVFAIALIAKGIRHPVEADAPSDETRDRWGHVRVTAVVVLIGLFIFALPSAGFLVASFALLFVLYSIGAGRPFSLFAVVAALLTSAAAYALFVLLLDVRLPKGLLG